MTAPATLADALADLRATVAVQAATSGLLAHLSVLILTQLVRLFERFESLLAAFRAGTLAPLPTAPRPSQAHPRRTRAPKPRRHTPRTRTPRTRTPRPHAARPT